MKSKSHLFLIVATCFLVSYMISAEAGELLGKWKFDDASGSTAVDTSDYSNDGILTNMDTQSCWVSGNLGTALSFDGNDDYVDCGNANILSLGDESFTIIAWIKTSVTDTTQMILSKKSSAYSDGFDFSISWINKLRFGQNGVYSYSETAGLVNDGNWHHVAVVVDHTNDLLHFYVDGVADGLERDISGWGSITTTNDLWIGNRLGNTFPFNGEIDEVRIYAYALPSYEINLTGQWEMNYGSGATVLDKSDCENTGTLIGNVAWETNGQLDRNGSLGKSLTFSGGYVDCGNASSLTLGDENFTITAWVKTSVTGSSQMILSKKSSAYSDGFDFCISSINKLRFGQNGVYSLSNTAGLVNDGNWHHVAVVVDRTNDLLYFYVDGVADGLERDISGWGSITTTNNLWIGNRIGGTFPFKGNIDKVLIYNRILDVEDIKKMALTVVPNQNYYTGENAEAIVSLNLAENADLIDSYLLAKDSSGNTLGINNSPSLATELTYSTSSLTNGENTINIELWTDNDELICCSRMNIMKRAANTGNEVKIDYKNNIVLRNGNGFFPIGIYMSQISSSGTTDFQSVSNAGFNTVIRTQYSEIAPSDATSYLAAAAQATSTANPNGLMVIDSLGDYSTVL